MYKIVACDLDETLLNSQRRVCECDRAAVAALRERGVKFVPATGRGCNSVQGTLAELGLRELKDEYVISYNGGALSENAGSRLMYFSGITFEQADALFKKGLGYDVCLHVYTLDTVYVYNYWDHERAYLDGRMEVTEFFERNIDFLRKQEIVKVIYVNTNQNYLRAIADELSPLCGELEVSYSSGRYLEFNRKGVCKGAGLRALAENLGVDMADTIAIGDNFNDLSMIEAAGLGAGVANTAVDVKPYCDYVCRADNDSGGVAEVLHRFILDV